ncbi:hypothetical protein quinque_004052 [Culex quinquefasciatus]
MEAKESGLADLPPKVLVMIFRRMPFADRLRMSAVCRHWNQLIFQHFCDRILLHLEDGKLALDVPRGALCGDRKYANVRLIGAFAETLLYTHELRFGALRDHVRHLHLVVVCLDVDLLAELLRKFANLQSLILFVENFQFNGSVRILKEGTLPNIRIFEGKGLLPSLKSLSLDQVGSTSKTGLIAFLKIMRQRNLPSVRHITMTCMGKNSNFRRNPTWLAWLNEFAPVLHSLNIDFMHSFMMARFFALNFPNLKALTLRMFALSPILFPSMDPFWPELGVLELERFEQFLSRLVSLYSLKIALRDVHFGEVADAIYSMDHLQELTVELVCEPNCANPLQLEDIWYMKNLRKLAIFCDHIEYPSVDRIKPMPLVEDLTLGKVKRIDFNTLKTVFPCVKILDVRQCPTVPLPDLAKSWRSLENLSLNLDQPSYAEDLIYLFGLRKLRVLRVFSKKGLVDRVKFVLGFASLEQLYLDGVWKGSLKPPHPNLSCRVKSFLGDL